MIDMKQERVANKNARGYVQERKPFTGSNIDAVWRKNNLTGDRMYVVTSYGTHWPLFIWENGVWYENVDRHSRTTKHRSQTHPLCDTVPMSEKDMVCLQYYGIGGVAAGAEVDWRERLSDFVSSTCSGNDYSKWERPNKGAEVA